jgi:carbon starvation protein
MLMESFVAIMALIAATTLDPGIYFAMNAPATVLGDTVQSASQAVNGFGFSVSPETLQTTANNVGEESIVGQDGGAPTLAVG